jgi:hypothetical protein
VVDLLGMSATSPFPGRSLAAYWKLPPHGEPPRDLTSPAFSERASTVAFQNQPGSGREHDGVEMSVAALGYHYTRNGQGLEQLFDVSVDPYEQVNLTETAADPARLAEFRKLLLDVLTGHPGSPEVEKAYLANYRDWLEEIVHKRPTQSVAAGGESTSIGR